MEALTWPARSRLISPSDEQVDINRGPPGKRRAPGCPAPRFCRRLCVDSARGVFCGNGVLGRAFSDVSSRTFTGHIQLIDAEDSAVSVRVGSVQRRNRGSVWRR